MVHLQVLSRTDAKLDTVIRAAIADKSIKSFEVVQVKGGLRIRHKNAWAKCGSPKFQVLFSPRWFARTAARNGNCSKRLVGRLNYHFKNEIAAINIQFEPKDDEAT